MGVVFTLSWDWRTTIAGMSKVLMRWPLNMLLKLNQEWEWGDEQERTFVEIKAKLVAAPILKGPIRGRPF
jgi:hypothetical protein